MNFVGGKVQSGETVIQAAGRELKEETGITGLDFRINGYIWHPQHLVWFLNSHTYSQSSKVIHGPEGRCEWTPIKEALKHQDLVPNLKLIIPLLQMKVENWRVIEDGPTLKVDFLPCSI